MKVTPHQGVHSTWLHLYEVQTQGKQFYGVRILITCGGGGGSVCVGRVLPGKEHEGTFWNAENILNQVVMT